MKNKLLFTFFIALCCFKLNAFQLSASVTVQSSICSGDCSGSIVISAVNGTEPYMYSFDGGQNYFATNLFSNLCAGVYTLYVQDATDDVVTLDVVITEPEELMASITSTSTGTEPGGVIEVFPTGGTPPYLTSIDGVNFQDSTIFNNLPMGEYEVSIVDENNCIELITIDVAFSNVINTVTVNNNMLTANLEAESYQWFNAGTGEPIDEATNRVFIAQEAGNYRVVMIVDVPGTTRSFNLNNNRRELVEVSSPVYEITNNSLSLNDNDILDLRIYPNPTENHLILQNDVFNQNFEIVSVSGKTVKKGKILANEISTQSLTAGIYFMKIEGYNVFKFIKN